MWAIGGWWQGPGMPTDCSQHANWEEKEAPSSRKKKSYRAFPLSSPVSFYPPPLFFLTWPGPPDLAFPAPYRWGHHLPLPGVGKHYFASACGTLESSIPVTNGLSETGVQFKEWHFCCVDSQSPGGDGLWWWPRARSCSCWGQSPDLFFSSWFLPSLLSCGRNTGRMERPRLGRRPRESTILADSCFTC